MTFLSFMCLEMVSRISYSITFPGIEVWLTSLSFPGSSFLQIGVIRKLVTTDEEKAEVLNHLFA